MRIPVHEVLSGLSWEAVVETAAEARHEAGRGEMPGVSLPARHARRSLPRARVFGQSVRARRDGELPGGAHAR